MCEKCELTVYFKIALCLYTTKFVRCLTAVCCRVTDFGVLDFQGHHTFLRLDYLIFGSLFYFFVFLVPDYQRAMFALSEHLVVPLVRWWCRACAVCELTDRYIYHLISDCGSPLLIVHVSTASSGETTTRSCRPVINSGEVPTVIATKSQGSILHYLQQQRATCKLHLKV